MAPAERSSAAGESSAELSLVRQIADYVTRHPRAVDTAEGIRSWWLRESDGVSQERLQSALDGMVSQGMITRRVLPDGQAVYGGVEADTR